MGFYPKSISVLSPIFNVRVSPLMLVSLPMSEKSRTISKRFEKEPIIEFLIIEDSIVVFSPMVALGPRMEFFILQPLPILTGCMMTVFSK